MCLPLPSHPSGEKQSSVKIGKASPRDIGLNGDGAGGNEGLREGEAEGCQE